MKVRICDRTVMAIIIIIIIKAEIEMPTKSNISKNAAYPHVLSIGHLLSYVLI